MKQPPLGELLKHVDSRYTLVVATASEPVSFWKGPSPWWKLTPINLSPSPSVKWLRGRLTTIGSGKALNSDRLQGRNLSQPLAEAGFSWFAGKRKRVEECGSKDGVTMRPRKQYASVVVDVTNRRVNRPFDYEIPEALVDSIQLGHRVFVPFGRRRVTGYVVGFPPEPGVSATREIHGLVDAKPLLTPEQVELARWMAQRYQCLLIDGIRAMVPAGIHITAVRALQAHRRRCRRRHSQGYRRWGKPAAGVSQGASRWDCPFRVGQPRSGHC